MTVLQIAILVCAIAVLWASAIALIVVWVMGMSRHAAIDEQTFRRHTGEAQDASENEPSTAPDRTPA